MTDEGSVTAADLQHLKREARAADAPGPEEQAFQEGWDAAYASIDEAGPRGSNRRAAQRPGAQPARPRGFLHRYREAMRLFGYRPGPSARARR